MPKKTKKTSVMRLKETVWLDLLASLSFSTDGQNMILKVNGISMIMLSPTTVLKTYLRTSSRASSVSKTGAFVVLLLSSLSSGVRLAMVTVVFFFCFLSSLFSNYVLYELSPTFIFCCCSPFSSHSFQISLNAVLPSHSRSSSPPFSNHFLDI